MIGQTISHYHILEKLGEGGMGVVYKAEDGRLRRTVALKFLPPQVLEDRERFLREAQAAASLNHTNICTVFEVDPEHDFIVMEFIAGGSVRERIAERPLPLGVAIDIAIQVCQGLHAAHDKRVVHRDIKPANLMLTSDGQVKITDFGLAQIGDRTRLTRTGTTLGTAAYMSPEQACGQPTHRQTDMWSLGVVLYEMLTGRLPFRGDSEQAVSSAILHTDPEPVTAQRSGIPLEVDRIIAKLLAKDPSERYPHAEDLLVDLLAVRKKVKSPLSMSAILNARATYWRPVALVVLAGLILAAAALAIPAVRRLLVPEPGARSAIRFSIAPPAGSTLEGSIAVAPDGSRIAMIATTAAGDRMVLVRRLDSMEARTLPGTEGALHPFWSPDGRFLAFFADGKLKRIRVDGGPPQALADVFDARGGSWNRDGVIVFAPNVGDRIYQIHESGGTPEPVTTLEPARQESSHQWPSFLPDGRHFLYLAWSERADGRGVYLGSLDGRTRRRLVGADWFVSYAHGPRQRGYLLFLRGHNLMAQRFDAGRFTLSGEPAVIGEVAWVDLTTPGLAAFSASANGVLAYRSGAARSTQLTWVDRSGRPLGVVTAPGAYRDPWLSPDARKVVTGKLDPETGTYDVWLYDLDRETGSRFSFHASDDGFPIWSPEGGRIVFASRRNGPSSLFEKASGGAGIDSPLLSAEASTYPTDWSPDGRQILFAKWDPKTKWDLWMLPLSGARKPVPCLQNEFDSFQAVAFPGSGPTQYWIAYTSNESGRYEVYVESYPATSAGTGGKWQISRSGGAQPRWSRDGRELFFLAPDRTLMSVPVRTGAAFSAGIPRPLFRMRATGLVDCRNHYVVHPDGQRFLVNALVEEGDASPISVVVNWPGTIGP